MECDNYWERNEYIDAILNVVLQYRGARRVLFSSFDPDICCMLVAPRMFNYCEMCFERVTFYFIYILSLIEDCVDWLLFDSKWELFSG